MFSVINNKIRIGKGETPLYSANFKYKDGSPFRLIDNTISNPHIVFIVRDGLHTSGDNYKFRKFLNLSDKLQFTDNNIYEYKPNDKILKRLFKRVENNFEEYLIYNGSSFVKYDFNIGFTFNHKDTAELPAKTYWYEISVIGGALNKSVNGKFYEIVEDVNGEYNESGDLIEDLDNYDGTRYRLVLTSNPFKEISYKKTIIDPSEFIVEGRLSE